MTTITQWIISPLESFRKWNAGPKPDISPKTILAEIGKDAFMNSMEFRLGKKSLHSDSLGQSIEQKGSVQIIQKGLIALGLIRVDTSKIFWWSRSNFAWGSYGPATKAAVYEVQTVAGIKNGKAGMILGPETLDALKVALTAKAEGKDWEAAIAKPAKK